MSAVGGSLLLSAHPIDLVQHATAVTSEHDNQTSKNKEQAVRVIGAISLLLDEDLAQDDSYTAIEETLLVVNAADGILSNDQADAGSTITVLQDVQNGSLNLAQDGSFTYLPAFDFTGMDSFRYLLVRGNGQSMEATVSIAVQNTDDGVPDAVDDSYLIDGINSFSENALDNDTILDAAEVVPVTNAATTLGGTITIASNGDFTYMPPATLGTQTDTYDYTLEDVDGDSDTATLSFTASAIVDVETARDVPENDTLTTEITLIPASAVEYLQLNNSQFNLAQLNSASTTPLEVDSEVHGVLQITDFDDTTGVVTLSYDPTGVTFDHTFQAYMEAVIVIFKSTNASTSVNGVLSIDITDIAPVANNDSRNITEGTSAIAGNAFGGAGASPFGDVADSLIDDANSVLDNHVTDIDFADNDGTVGTGLIGAFGTMIISNTGVYTYTLDNTNINVQGITTGETLTEVFTYEITDRDGSTDTADITVTIDGVDDPAPVVTIPDANGAALGKQSVAENATLNGSFTLTNLNAEATNFFEARDGEGNLLSDNPADIANATVFNLTRGQFTINSYNGFTVDYTYDPTGTNQDHSAGDTTILDEISFSVANAEGDSDSDTLGILITDTAPTAALDSASITEDGILPTATGDALTNDTSGADTAISVSLVGYNMVNQTVGIPFPSSFGTLDLNADGTYTYTLDNTNSTVDALDDGEQLTEEFNYTITDTDGDTSSSTLTVTINGMTDPP